MPDISVAVMNTSKEVTEILQEALEYAGFTVCTTYTYLFKDQRKKFDEFMKNNNPDVIVYDIAIPYKENFELFKELSSKPIAKKSTFVLTTTNKSVLESIVGSTSTFEIVGKPFDLNVIVKKVKDAYTKMNSNM